MAVETVSVGIISGTKPYAGDVFGARLPEVVAVRTGIILTEFPENGKSAGKLSNFAVLPDS